MNDQQFVLRWHYHDETLVRNLPCFLENDILTDVVLSVGAQQFKAHRLILAMCSAYFFQLFQEINSQQAVIVLHNVSIEDIRAILAFIYKGQCIVTKEHLPNLLSVAKLLKIQGLCDMKVPEKQVVQNESETDTKYNRNLNEISKICDSIVENTGIRKQARVRNNNLEESLAKKQNNWEKSNIEKSDPQEPPPPHPPKKQNCKDASETCKCFLCGKYLSNQYNLRVHMETHEEAFHACQSCPHVSRSRDALRKHVSYRHPEEYHTRKRKKLEHV